MTMTLKHLISITLVFIFIASCREKETTTSDIPITLLDTTITAVNAFTLIRLDSQAVSRYLDSAALNDTSKLLFRNFYNSRNFQYAWIDSNRLTEHANMLWNRYSEYRDYAKNAPLADTLLDRKIEQWSTEASESVS